MSYQRIIVFIIQKLMDFSPKFWKLKMHSWDKTILLAGSLISTFDFHMVAWRLLQRQGQHFFFSGRKQFCQIKFVLTHNSNYSKKKLVYI